MNEHKGIKRDVLETEPNLGSSYEADQDDVRGMKTALTEVGEYTPPRDGINGWTDDALFDGMKRFQKKRGLHVDGVARPGGPTETNLNSALAEGLTQVRPVNAPSKPARRDEDDETRAAFGATPKKTDRHGILKGVPSAFRRSAPRSSTSRPASAKASSTAATTSEAPSTPSPGPATTRRTRPKPPTAGSTTTSPGASGTSNAITSSNRTAPCSPAGRPPPP
jgi:hypothetical protein